MSALDEVPMPTESLTDRIKADGMLYTSAFREGERAALADLLRLDTDIDRTVVLIRLAAITEQGGAA